MSGDDDAGGCGVDPVTGRVLETPEIRTAGLAALRTLMAESVQKGEVTAYPRDDDAFLLPFLRARKYKISKAHMVLNNFAKFWYNPKHRDIINGLCAARARPFMDLGMMELLPVGYTDRKGNHLVLLHAGRLDYSKFTGRQQMEATLYMLACMFDNEEMQLQGMTYVESFENFSLSAAMGINKAMTKEEQKELMAVFMDTFPVRIRDIWVIQQPWYFTMVWTVAKLFFKRKITKRVHLLGSKMEQLHEAVDPAFLPPSFGGTSTVEPDRFMRDLEEIERTRGTLGGFAIPFNVDDPTGRARGTMPEDTAAATTAIAGSGVAY